MLLDKFTAKPSEGAGALSVTVPIEVAPNEDNVKYLKTKNGSQISVKYKRSSDDCAERCKEQDAIIQELRAAGAKLLNGMGYNYRTANREEERAKVHNFCDALLPREVKRDFRSENVSICLAESTTKFCVALSSRYRRSKSQP